MYTPYFIHLPVCGHLTCVHLLDILNSVTVNMDVWVMCESLLSPLLCLYPEADNTNHIAFLCLIFWGLIVWFPTVTTPFYMPMNNIQVFHFLHIPINTYCIFCFLDNTHPNRWEIVSNLHMNLFNHSRQKVTCKVENVEACVFKRGTETGNRKPYPWL